MQQPSKNFLYSKLAPISSALLWLLGWVNYWLDWGILGISSLSFLVLAIFFSALILWLFVAIDWPSILVIISLGLLPGLNFSEVFKLSFGNTTFVFLLFTFVVTYALQDTYFLKRVAAWALNGRWSQASPQRFILAFLTVVLALACFISPTILFMIVFPLYEEIAHQFGLEKGDPSASRLLLALITTIALGTAMTPINHVFAITAMGIYESAFNQAISNSEYILFAVPTGLLIFLLLLTSLKYIWGLNLEKVSLEKVSSLENIPPMSLREKATVMVFACMVLMWILPDFLPGLYPQLANFFKEAGIAFPPMVAAFLLSVVHIHGDPLLNIQKGIKEGVYWPSLLIVAATLSLGAVLADPDYGVTALIQSGLSPLILSLSPMMIVLIFMSWASLQTNVSSNLVTTSVVTTLLTTLVIAYDSLAVNAAAMACFIGFMASLALMTPPAMPYVAISIGSGWTRSRDAFIYGLWMVVLSIVIVTFIGYPLASQVLSHLR